MTLLVASLLAPLVVILAFLSLKILFRPRKNPVRFVLIVHKPGYTLTFWNSFRMKRLSLAIAEFIITLVALSVTGLQAAIDGAIAVVSSDPSVLLVTPLDDGTFHVKVVGVGLATLTVTADADLGEGVKTIEQVFEFEIYDSANAADHFELTISDLITQASITPTEPAEATADTETTAENTAETDLITS